jgi:hypothetical protein
MKLFLYIFVFLCSLLQVALAVQSHKAVVITYPQDTPDSVVDEAKKAITDAVSCTLLTSTAIIH